MSAVFVDFFSDEFPPILFVGFNKHVAVHNRMKMKPTILINLYIFNHISFESILSF